MRKSLSARVAVLLPAIQARWVERLVAEPPQAASPVAFVTPEMLHFMVAPTLTRLVAALELGAGGGPRPPAVLASLRADCRCGLHLVLSFYRTGQDALGELLAATPERTVVLQQFQRIADEEIASLCEICTHRGGAQCGHTAAPGG